MGKIADWQMKLTPKQFECFNALEFTSLTDVLAGGGKGGGKSNMGCKWSYYKAKEMIQFFGLAPSRTPPIVGFIGRKRGSDLLTTTLETWKKEIPPEAYRINEMKKLIVIEGTASILYGGFDDRETINKFNSMEIVFAFIDQAEELDRTEIGSIRGTLRLKINGKQPPYKMLLSCNPPITDDEEFLWIKDEFIDNPNERRRFFKFLWRDNPFIASNYEQTLKDAYGFNPDLFAAYAEGEWDRIGKANLVIMRRDAELCVNRNVPLENETFRRRFTVADISEENGEDETVIYDFEETRVVGQEIYAHRDLMDTCGRLVVHQQKNNSNLISVDKVGSGAGVWSRLKEVYADKPNIVIHGFDSRTTDFPSEIDKETYANYRAYAYFNASQEFFKSLRCSIPNDPKLINQLCRAQFMYTSNGKRILRPKKEGGDSPDRADALVIGLDAYRIAKPLYVEKTQGKFYVNPHFTNEAMRREKEVVYG